MDKQLEKTAAWVDDIVDDALADERNKKTTISRLLRNSQKIKSKTA